MTGGAPRLSVMVVSHGRPRALCRCLTGLWQQHRPGAEVVVVADAAGLAAARALPFADRLDLVEQVGANIARARNDGIARSAGDVVAFLDDDAVAEPGWTAAIGRTFAAAPALAASTGPVLGRNGISLQWGEIGIDGRGRDLPSRPGGARKLHGTNMAWRRSALVALGGFDPAFAFYLDDTDLAFRAARAGMATAWDPEMVVHHGFAASARRDDRRVPRDLSDIGASTAVYLRKHAPEALEAELRQTETDQRNRLMRLARQRRLGAPEIRALMQGLQDGIAAGRRRDIGGAARLDPPARAFRPLRDTAPGPVRVLSGWRHRAQALRAEAAAAVAAGGRAVLILVEPTPRKHKVAFTEGGWWEQTGGLYGPSDRDGARLQAWRRQARVLAERRRLGAICDPDYPD